MRPKLLSWSFVANLIHGASIASAGVAIPSDVSVDVQANQSSNLHPGDRTTFTVTATNHGPNVISEWAFRSAPIYDELDLVTASTDCFGQFFVSVVDLENSFYYNSTGTHRTNLCSSANRSYVTSAWTIRCMRRPSTRSDAPFRRT